MATLKDIANKTNLSISTISRVLKNDKTLKVNEKTRLKILQACKELKYKVKHTTYNGFKIVIINWYSHDQEIIDPYYYYIRKAVEEECVVKGFEYITIFKEDDLNLVNNYDGIIAIGKFNKEQAQKLELISSKIVFIDSNPEVNKYDSIEVDFNIMIKNIIDYIISINESKIGMLMGIEEINGEKYVDDRLVSFKKYTKEKDVYDERYVIEGKFSLESGYEMFMVLYNEKRLPKVIICGNDLIAMGANKAAYKCDLIVGKDIKIIGINDIPMSKYMVPSLTTVVIHQSQMGKEGVRLLNRRITSDQEEVKLNIKIPTKLKVRKST